MGLMSSKIEREKLRPGDHIYTWKNSYSYSHHGIYVGDGKVIHLTRGPGLIISSSSRSIPSNDRVVCCNIEDFLCDGQLHLFEYGVSRVDYVIKRAGTCSRASSNPPEEVLHRASYLVKHGFGDYHLVDKNCEDFALYCKTGTLKKNESATGISGQVTSILAAIGVLSSIPYRFLPFSLYGVALLVCGLYCSHRLFLDVGSKSSRFAVVAVEKLDKVRRKDKMENGTGRYPGPWLYFVYTIWVSNCWYWTPESTILVWFKSVWLYFLLYSFVNFHLKKLKLGDPFKLGEYSAYTIWLLGYWYWRWTSVSTILLWTRSIFLCLSLRDFISIQVDNPRRLKLKNYCFNTMWVLELWYWSPGSTILQWIKLAGLDLFLLSFAAYHLTKYRLILRWAFFACLVIQLAALFLGLNYSDCVFRITALL